VTVVSPPLVMVGTMNLFTLFRQRIVAAITALAADGLLPEGLDLAAVTAEPPREATHGDIASNAAMALAKQARLKPREIAEKLAPLLQLDQAVAAVEIAGPGFINLRLVDSFWHDRLAEILAAGVRYGDSTLGQGAKVDVEYVSANPTGPMHIGHCRGAVFGDALSNLLTKAGFDVCREYYINDAGAQVDVLARSAHLRYREALGETITIPEGLYPGDYLKPVGVAIAARDGGQWLGGDEATWLGPVRDFAIDAMMRLIRDDLATLGIRHDVFTSERRLYQEGKVQQAIDTLQARGLIYRGVLEPPKGKTPEDWEPREQLLFRATQFGDDVDRPLQKSDGSWTYFATDIACHFDKFERGYPAMIDVWGADHGGYVKRMQAAVKALAGAKRATLDVKICQLVNLLDGGVPVKMSKRAGSFVTLRDVVDEVGKDVVRFIMLTRKNDAPLDFDFAKVTEQSKDNPVFYVQYAHARAHSVLRHATADLAGADLTAPALAQAEFGRLSHAAELALLKLMASWPRLVESAADAHEPHRIAFYLYDLASAFHGLWNMGKEDASLRFIIADDRALTLARLALTHALATVIASGLAVIGVHPVEEMR
jgi:arginyl-tRNA synthetase